MHGEYPVDCIRVSDGAHEQQLFFCIYGKRCDTIYPVGFYRQPFEGDFDFELSDFIGASKVVEFMGNSKKPAKLGGCLLADNKTYSIGDSMEQATKSDAAALLGHVAAQYGRVFKRDGARQQSSNRLTSHSEPSSTQEVKCYFSGQLAISGCELKIPMYRVISREGILNKSVNYEMREVAIPRCSEARELHDKMSARDENGR